MEEGQENRASRTSRFVLLTALVLLCASAGGAFGGVFQGMQPALELAAVGAIAVVLASVMERRHVAMATAVSLLGLVVVAGILVFPDSTWFGVPTLSTLRSFLRAFAEVGRVAESHVAPSPPVAPLLLAGVTAVWTATFSSHLLAVRARSPFLAILPPGTLMAFTSLVVQSSARRLYVALFLISALALLYGDGLRRISQWGPLTQWRGRGGARATTVSGRGARRLAFACLAIALITPGILPGFRSKALLNVRGRAENAFVSVDPIVDIRPALARRPALQLLTVWSNKTAYWRSLSLDTFNGRLWTSSDENAENGIDIRAGTLKGATEVENSSLIRQRFRFDRLNQQWLPAAFDPVAISIRGKEVRYDPASSALVSLDGTEPGFTYDVTSRVVSPPPDALDDVPLESNVTAARYTGLPPDTPAEIYAIARKLTSRYPTMYRKVLAIQAYLRTFEYNERAAPGHGLNDVLYFLTRSKSGYCEQFAGTMAVLLRALGIPARVAVGFTPGIFDAQAGAFRVTTKNFHSWVEVLFPRFGWLPFEPTPSRADPTLEYTAVSPTFERHNPPTQEAPECITTTVPAGLRGEPGATTCTAGTSTTESVPPGAPNQRVRDPNARAGVPSNGDPQAKRDSGGSSVPWIAFVVVAALVGVIPLAKTLWRRQVVRRARTPRDRVLAAYSTMSAKAADLGLGRRDDETIGEYATRLKAMSLFSDGHLDRLTQLAGVAAYGSGDVPLPSAKEAVDISRTVAKEISRSRDAPTRVLALFRVRPGLFVRPGA